MTPQKKHRAHSACIGPIALLIAALSLFGCQRDVQSDDTATPQSDRWTTVSERGHYQITLAPREGRAVIGEFQDWTLEVLDGATKGVKTARLSIDGGMPEHGHGLPTRPQVTDYLGDGKYLVEGLRFNMAGAWKVQLGIVGPAGPDSATLDVDLAF